MSGVLYYGDNLPVLRKWVEDESVDLIYLDPPFNSKRMFNQVFKESAAQSAVFKDYWEWDDAAEAAYREIIGTASHAPRALVALLEALHRVLERDKDLLAYLSMMGLRLLELHRVLKPTGSLYLHCDPTASHYLKLILDAVFGGDKFGNEIIWQRTNARIAADRWPRVHDTLLFYSKTEKPAFTPLKIQAEVAKLPHTLITGADGQKYQTFELTAPNLRFGETGKEWRGFQPAKMGRCWANPPAVMDQWDEQGLIHWPKKPGAWPRRRAAEPFTHEDRMVTVGDVWTDIDRINQSAKERLGYPTQKPLALLTRILEASSRPGDVVLDPFCGCGTTIEACESLGREWVGIDVAPQAVGIIRDRMEKIGVTDLKVVGWPMDLDGAKMLARDDKIGFQRWAVFMAGGRLPDGRHYSGGADGGVDGEVIFDDGGRKLRAIISVKGGGVGANDIRVLRNVVVDTRSEMGIFLSMLEPTKAMRDVARDGGFFTDSKGVEHRKIQLYTAEQLLKRERLDIPGLNVTPESTRPGPRKGQTLALPFGRAGTAKTGKPKAPKRDEETAPKSSKRSGKR